MVKKVLIVIPPLINSDEGNGFSPKTPVFERYRLVSPVEPTAVAANLINRGFEVKLFDLGLYTGDRFDRLTESLATSKPDALVMVQSVLTFSTAQDWDGKRVFDLARTHCRDIVTVLTGSHATNFPGKAVSEGVCDFSIKGEVDFAVGELLSAVNVQGDLSSLPGLAYRLESGELSVSQDYPKVNLADLPLPAYHLLKDEDRVRYAKVLEFGKIRFPEKSCYYRDIMTSRGCIMRCSFCCVTHMRGNTQKYRRKSLEMVVAEIEAALEDGIEEIHFFDDLFARDEKEILELTNEIVRRNLRFHWFVAQGMPLWPLTRNSLEAMKETGMYRIICPLESGNNRVLKEVAGKALSSVEHHHDVLLWAHSLGLEIIGLFVVGMPGEKRYEILDTIKFAEEHPEIDYSVFSIATPMIGTRLIKQVTQRGWLHDTDKINRIIKRTVSLYHTEAFKEYELGVIRAFDWDRINFSTPERQAKYARMVGITFEQLQVQREYAKRTFYRYFPDYDGPLSFKDLYDQPDLFQECTPRIPG